MNVLSIGYAKQILRPESRDAKRMSEYAAHFDEFHIVIFTRASEGFPTYEQRDNLHIYATNAQTKVGMVIAAIRQCRRILKEQPAKQWTMTAQDPFVTTVVMLLAAWGTKAKRQLQVHGDVFSSYYYRTKPSGFVLKRWVRFAMRFMDGIRVVSKRIYAHIPESVRARIPVTVLPIQPQLDPFIAVGQSRSYEEHTTKQLLYVGRFAPEKNIPMLLKSVAALRYKYALKLTLLGSGEEAGHLRALVAKLKLEDTVEFQNWNDDVSTLMGGADMLCLTSDHEGYGLVILEAMAAGLPVVSTDVGCAGELLLDETHGLIVPVRRVEAYTAALERLLANPALIEQYGRAGHAAATAAAIPADEYIRRYCHTLELT